MNWLLMSLGLLLSSPIPASDEARELGFPDDDLEARLARVSDGELTLLESAPADPVHHHSNSIWITKSSLMDGWVKLEQCHSQLDPVAETQIVYHPERIRKIRILSSDKIDQSRVEGASVQLSGIDREARLCLSAESRALTHLGKGHYRLRNGPYMRRFLDGYYPMRVSLEIIYPPQQLELIDFRPAPGGSGKTLQKPDRILWDSWSKGQLFTEFDFHLKKQP